MSLWSAISQMVYREYDRRIKRASLITEYGAVHHASHAADHAEHIASSRPVDRVEEDAGEVEIVNVPRGTPIGASPSPHDSHSAQSPRK